MSKKFHVLQILFIILVCVIIVSGTFYVAKESGYLESETIIERSIFGQKHGIEIPTEEDVQELENLYQNIIESIQNREELEQEIAAIYEEVKSAKVPSKCNRYNNQLQEKLEAYLERVSQIQEQIAIYENKYDTYLELVDLIPEYAISKVEEYNEFLAMTEQTYENVCELKQTILTGETELQEMAADSQRIADDFRNSCYEIMCKIGNAEAGNCPDMEICYVLNVIENRVEHPEFAQTTVYAVIYAPGQYSPTWNGAINKIPSARVRRIVDQYLRGEIETGMPSNVVYQATFTQGSGIWMAMSSGHYFCYY